MNTTFLRNTTVRMLALALLLYCGLRGLAPNAFAGDTLGQWKKDTRTITAKDLKPGLVFETCTVFGGIVTDLKDAKTGKKIGDVPISDKSSIFIARWIITAVTGGGVRYRDRDSRATEPDQGPENIVNSARHRIRKN